jgi:predicted DNA-binding transcriptional regulator YafY
MHTGHRNANETGSAHLRLRLSCLEEIEQYVLSWGTHATIIEPLALRNRVARVGRSLAAKYPEEKEGAMAG